VNSFYSFVARVVSSSLDLVRSAYNMAQIPGIFNAAQFFGKYFCLKPEIFRVYCCDENLFRHRLWSSTSKSRLHIDFLNVTDHRLKRILKGRSILCNFKFSWRILPADYFILSKNCWQFGLCRLFKKYRYLTSGWLLSRN